MTYLTVPEIVADGAVGVAAGVSVGVLVAVFVAVGVEPMLGSCSVPITRSN